VGQVVVLVHQAHSPQVRPEQRDKEAAVDLLLELELTEDTARAVAVQAARVVAPVIMEQSQPAQVQAALEFNLR
jgi:hypothetical protein